MSTHTGDVERVIVTTAEVDMVLPYMVISYMITPGESVECNVHSCETHFMTKQQLYTVWFSGNAIWAIGNLLRVSTQVDANVWFAEHRGCYLLLTLSFIVQSAAFAWIHAPMWIFFLFVCSLTAKPPRDGNVDTVVYTDVLCVMKIGWLASLGMHTILWPSEEDFDELSAYDVQVVGLLAGG